MGTYIVAQLKFTRLEKYRRYQQQFPEVFAQFNGTVVIAEESARCIEGDWPYDKLVVLYFATEQDALKFQNSSEYRSISDDRKAGADATVIIAGGRDLEPVS